jgi:hypothetical protein
VIDVKSIAGDPDVHSWPVCQQEGLQDLDSLHFGHHEDVAIHRDVNERIE